MLITGICNPSWLTFNLKSPWRHVMYKIKCDVNMIVNTTSNYVWFRKIIKECFCHIKWIQMAQFSMEYFSQLQACWLSILHPYCLHGDLRSLNEFKCYYICHGNFIICYHLLAITRICHLQLLTRILKAVKGRMIQIIQQCVVCFIVYIIYFLLYASDIW